MRVIFMGTPAFAVPSLRALASRHDVVAVYTRPDRPAGRGRKIAPSAVGAAAAELGIPVEQPSAFDDTELSRLAAFEPDVAVVAAYGAILPAAAIDGPRYGTVNVHASLLPRWRGAAPVQRAILAGDEVTGLSIMRIVERVDAGPYAAQVTVPVGAHTCDSLTAALAAAAPAPLLSVIGELADGSVVWTEQNESLATYAPKVGPADVALDPTLAVEDAWRRVRASSRSAPARAAIAGTPVTVLSAEAAEARVPAAGVIASKNALLLGFADGSLRVISLTPGGRAPMEGAAWARGARLTGGATWGPVA